MNPQNKQKDLIKSKEKLETRNVRATIIILIAGIILIESHYIGGLGIIGLIGDFLTNESVIEDQILIDIIISVIWLIGIIGSLGGISVILGGFLVFFRKKFLGKIFISLGTGIGIIGLIILFVTTAYSGLYQFFGLLLLIIHSSGWFGIILSIYGRMLIN